ncbi:MAG: response regulator [Cellvibrionaceae bacterium]|nr:response regulator [Cellvibrionaceae bacterium]
MKILIVDDSRAMQTIIRRGIDELGYHDIETRQASSAAEGLNVIRTWEPALVLCDWHMPEMTGLELLYAINREMLGIHVGFVTTETAAERKREALEAGAKFFVQKPFDNKTLHSAILPLIQNNPADESALAQQQAHERDEGEGEDKNDNHLCLPDTDSLRNIIQHFCKAKVSLKPSEPLTITQNKRPYLLALLEDPENKKIRAIIIVDSEGTCVLGGAVTAIAKDKVLKAIQECAIAKAMINNCEKLIEAISISIFDKNKLITLNLRSTTMVHNRLDSVEKLTQNTRDERIDVTIDTERYGSGRLTIIAS